MFSFPPLDRFLNGEFHHRYTKLDEGRRDTGFLGGDLDLVDRPGDAESFGLAFGESVLHALLDGGG